MKIPITPIFLISALITQVLSVPVVLPADLVIPDPESVESRVHLLREASPFTNEHAQEPQPIPGASRNTPTEETRNLANSDSTDDQGAPEGTPTKKAGRGRPRTSAAWERNSGDYYGKEGNRGESRPKEAQKKTFLNRLQRVKGIKTHQELVDYYQLPDPPNARKVQNRQRVRRLNVARMRADAAAAGIEIPEDLEELFAVRTSNKRGEEPVTRTRVATNPTYEESDTLHKQEKFPGQPKLLPQSPLVGLTNEMGGAQEATRIPKVADYRRMHREAADSKRKPPVLLPKPSPPKKSDATQERRT